MTKTSTTTSHFRRSHQVEPRGRGNWAFQVSVTYTAYERDLRGDVVFVQGTFTEAKAEAAKLLGNPSLMAVLA